MSSYYNQGVQVIVGNGQNFPGTPRISLIPFIQNAYDKGLLNFTVLPPGSISLAEIENIATSKILGRSTAGSGVIEQISIGTGLSLSGGTLSSTVTATPGGSDTQIQYNNAGVFGGSSQLIANIGATNTLDIQGSGATSATNALRVRNSSGTNLLTVRNDGKFSYGSSGQIYIESFSPSSYYNIIGVSGATGNYSEIYRPSGTNRFSIENATKDISLSTPSTPGSYSGVDGIVIKGTTSYIGFGVDVPLATAHFAKNTTASTPSMLLSGTGYSGGTATTTKPTFLIEPTGTTSTGWSTSGTKLGVNAESGFTGNLLDLQLNGVSAFSVNRLGALTVTSDLNAGGNTSSGVGNAIYWRTRSQMWSDADGNIRLVNTAGTTFGLLQFGGTTSSFPAIKRNGAGIDIRLADDSGYGNLGTGVLNNFANTTASTPSMLLSGTGYSGGTATTTKPTLLIEPTGTTSTGWSTSGTKLGINAESGFAGNLMDLQVNGSQRFVINTASGGFQGVNVGGNQFTFVHSTSPTTNSGLRITSNGTGKTYIDGWSDGATKAGNYDLIIGSRGNNTGSAITGSTTAENGTNVQIGFDATSNPRAILSLNSTTRGFLPPRLTTAERDAVTWVAGDAGMMIFNTTLVKLQVWNGAAWETITSV